MDDDPDKSEECLKSALWFAVGKIVDEAALERNINASPQFIGALSEMVWMQIESVATDIENFAHHAGRTTVKTDDVLLLSRNNSDLHALLKDHIDKKEAEKQAKKK